MTTRRANSTSTSSSGSSGDNNNNNAVKTFEIIWQSDPVQSPEYLSPFQKNEFERFHTKFYDSVAVSKVVSTKSNVTVTYGLDDHTEEDPTSLFSLVNYRVGDFVYCAQADDNNRNYFTAQIRAFYQKEGGSKFTKYMCHLQWLYRPTDLAPDLYDANPKELLGGYWIDANPVTLLRGHFSLLFGFSATSMLLSKVQAPHHYFVKSMFYETKGHTPYTETLPREGKLQGQFASNVIPVGSLAEIYNLQNIMKRRLAKSGDWEYLVQWEDWNEQSWVPESELDSNAITRFLKDSKKNKEVAPSTPKKAPATPRKASGTPKKASATPKKTPSTPSRRSSRSVTAATATPKKTPSATPKKQKKKGDKKSSKKAKKVKTDSDEDASWSEAEYEDAEEEDEEDIPDVSDSDISAEEEAEVKQQQAKKRRLSEAKASSKEPKPKARKKSKKSKSKAKSKGAPDGEEESDDDSDFSDALTHPGTDNDSPLFQSTSSIPFEESDEAVVDDTQNVTSQQQCSVEPIVVDSSQSQNNTAAEDESEDDNHNAEQVEEEGTQTQEDDDGDPNDANNKSCCIS